MDYKPLKNYYYKDKNEYDKIFELRTNSINLIRFPIWIKDHRSKKENQAFIVCTWEMTRVIEDIIKYLSDANFCYEKLPIVAQKYYVTRCLIDEIQTTNDIEGIFSTKKEIKDTYDSLVSNKQLKEKKFKGMVNKYMKLIEGDYELELNGSSDIRNLYDEIVRDEIPDDKQPNGVIFRSETVYVASKTKQIRHEGVNPEAKIIEFMDQNIALLYGKELPDLVKIAAFHYFFGYIHPFYDGNGRINRFISSYLLSRRIDPLLALDLSYIIKKNRNEYYRLFRICNKDINKGDITPFVIGFLEFVRQSAEYICNSLQEGETRLDSYLKQIYREDFEKKYGQHSSLLMNYFVQNALFAPAPFTIDELSELMGRSRVWMSGVIKKIIELGMPIVKGKDGKKVTYSLDLHEFDNMIDS